MYEEAPVVLDSCSVHHVVQLLLVLALDRVVVSVLKELEAPEWLCMGLSWALLEVLFRWIMWRFDWNKDCHCNIRVRDLGWKGNDDYSYTALLCI